MLRLYANTDSELAARTRMSVIQLHPASSDQEMVEQLTDCAQGSIWSRPENFYPPWLRLMEDAREMWDPSPTQPSEGR